MGMFVLFERGMQLLVLRLVLRLRVLVSMVVAEALAYHRL